ncbi:cytochrome b [Pseudovibrio ascidiaceicola]|uniref:Cytochrome b561 n=1 Tax=Pseudovibrio ascidiaceicola TaxID=285279 RepID=A0A1I3W2S1_9HYPH|nr:cytochrome b/b6 domain-containing protein [Pseudovibrio ascidiaceicola]SFK01934.1 cytochrome b561 [Pseudovibrio ascidiaceicola]
MAYQVAGYSVMAKTYHWIVAILVLIMVPMGLVMTDLGPGALQNTLYFYHKSIGILLFLLVVLRLLQHWITPAPPPPASLAPVLRIVSRSVHGLLYLVLIANPILGWIGLSLYGAPMPFFGLFDLPSIVPQNRPASESVLDFHATVGVVFAWLITLHILGALYHWLIAKDGIIERMTTAPYQKPKE